MDIISNESSEENNKKVFFTKSKVIILVVIFLIVSIIGGIIGYNYYTTKKKHDYEIQYQTNFSQATLDILNQTIVCEGMTAMISSSWNSAIDNDEDFNTALENVHKAWEDGGNFKTLENKKSSIEKEMIKLQNPPQDYQKAYDLFVELYSKYGQLYNQAVSPTGSLTSYNNDVNEKSSDFNEIYDKLVVVRPELKSLKK
jgi:hypothetical protein